MLVFFNGRFIAESEARVSAFDRGYLYGDGLFDTVRIINGRPFLWDRHLDRLMHGAGLMLLNMPFGKGDLTVFAIQLIEENNLPDCVLRIHVSRSGGPRGYSPRKAKDITTLISLHPPPEPPPEEGLKIVMSTQYLPHLSSLCSIKTSSRMAHVLAAAEAEVAAADDSLLQNTDSQIVEATSSNLFWVEGDVVCTPPLECGCLPGITREFMLQLCPGLDLRTAERPLTLVQLAQASGVFLTNSVHGLRPVRALGSIRLPSSPAVAKLQDAYNKASLRGEWTFEGPQ